MSPPIDASPPGEEADPSLAPEAAAPVPSEPSEPSEAGPMDPLLISGLTIFLVSYVPALVTGLVAGAIAGEDDDGELNEDSGAIDYVPLILPVAGPAITGALVPANDAGWALLGTTSGLQALGIVLLAIGATRDDPSSDPSLAVVDSLWPVLLGDGRSSLGLGATGRF